MDSDCPAEHEKAPDSSAALSSMLYKWATCNKTTYDFFLSTDGLTADLRKNWVPLWNCQTSNNCWCSHVAGDLDKSVNPDGWKKCEVGKLSHGSKVQECAWLRSKSCRCYTGRGEPCLFGHMSPGKLLYVIAVARASGATHLIEEGREGGLSAFAYNLHGLKVTSVEYAPLDSPTRALTELAPEVRLLNGDGGVLVPEIVNNLTDADAARTIVMFDGEKRWSAYKTYEKIKHRVAAAIFDDTNVEKEFRKFLLGKETAILDTGTDEKFAELKKTMQIQLRELSKLFPASKFGNFVESYTETHFNKAMYTIVKGGGWRSDAK